MKHKSEVDVGVSGEVIKCKDEMEKSLGGYFAGS